MRNIVIVPNNYKDRDYAVSCRVAAQLQALGARIFLAESLRHEISLDGIQYYEGAIPEEAEMLLVIGGDGSVLDAAAYAIGAGVPLLGINLGRLGYLAELDRDELDSLSRLIEGDFEIRERMTFAVTLVHGGEETILSRRAVNDVVIAQAPGEGMSEILLEDGIGHHLAYLADGVIVATPLGSTAYSLAAGGPVMDASLSAFCVTPICAHSLFSRSVLFPPEYTLTLTNHSAREGKMLVTVDGAEQYELMPGDEVRVARSADALKMITLKKQSALGVLCRKMQLLNPGR